MSYMNISDGKQTKLKNKMRRKFKKNGFTMVETLVAISIGVVVLTVVIFSISGFRNNKTLEKNVGQIKSLIEQARNQSVTAKNDLYYGIHVQTNGVVLYSVVASSSAYNANATDNISLALDSNSVIDNISIANAGSDILFKKITGEAVGTQYGSFRVKLLNPGNNPNSATSSIISVSPNGVISSQ